MPGGFTAVRAGGIIAVLERSIRVLRWIAIVLVGLYAAGFAIFVSHLPKAPREFGRVDGIVALTGGGSRLDVAVALFEKGIGERLLISGVNTQATKQDLKKLVHGRKRFDCCADLGYAAENTLGNAKEAASWARFYHFKRILLVTSRYHMPRSEAEFHDAMPELTVIPYPVDPAYGRGSWSRLRILHSEYVKYLAVTVLTAVGLEPDLDHEKSSAESRATT
jgi:uncharacterized SAM-binding protein YcdF (DUF218 family)